MRCEMQLIMHCRCRIAARRVGVVGCCVRGARGACTGAFNTPPSGLEISWEMPSSRNFPGYHPGKVL